MNRNTLRTIFGFCATMIRKFTGLSLRGNRPEAVYNYRQINEQLHTSGQPTEGQFVAIHAAGFDRVVNLAPAGAENALPDEAAILERLGIDYIHIPVHFKHPAEEDFARFSAVLAKQGDKPIWIHCAANMRVSAFVYRYRRDVLGEDEATIAADLQAIWEPFGEWRTFLRWR
ncbi:TIGR01244 family protein [Parasphingorhabdus marina DSM 22363]|uniref:TIGR01244 family protein n=1 Tax=Parasphingorhabdus marina DSM 22363 TaxID=1123272 RepID=A0A1N6H0F6_9SPHN|nr:protein tyrosine phosphatase family protein [Parasphingorhabdus marina]SIO13274.1 TIGR01244 family protein [Parasphingorhabdus marina DSM 22363]